VSVTPFPGPSRPKDATQEDFEREVAARFGLVPNFFRSAPDAPYGPAPDGDAKISGLGGRIMQAFGHQIDATITNERNAAGYTVTVTVPLRTDLVLDQT
jgi:hypothetical protein